MPLMRHGWMMMFALCLALLPAAHAAAQAIPRLPQAQEDRWNFDSPLWGQALKLEGFKLPEDQDPPTQPIEPTQVSILHDGKRLHILFTAMDREPAKIKAGPFEEFADTFPIGDHGQVTLGGNFVFAFDPHGNRYDAKDYDRDYHSGFEVRSRILEDRWQSIVIIPLRGFVDRKGGFKLQLVRHEDHGRPTAVRSYLNVARLEPAGDDAKDAPEASGGGGEE